MDLDRGWCSVFCEENHQQTYCEQIQELWQQKALCDINVIAESEDGQPMVSVSAHRIVLAANIPFFRAMFTSNMQEASQTEVTLKNVDGTGLKKVVAYAYSGKVEITEDSAQGVFDTANMLGLPRIVKACSEFMCTCVSSANCLGLRQFARLHDLSKLFSAANDFVMDNFAAVSREEEFLMLSVDEVEALVASNQINVQSEEDVYEAVVRWIKHDLEEHGQYTERLYKHIRFPIVSRGFLKNVVKHDDFMLTTGAGKIMLQEAVEYHENPASDILFSNPKMIQPRSSVMGVLCVVGGMGDSGNSLNEVTVFSPQEQAWRQGTKMLQHRSRLALALYKGELYAIGGYDLNDSLSLVEKYSPAANSWMFVASLNTPRRSCAAVVTKQGIFAIGGFSGSVYLKSVEFYDADLDDWTYQAAMMESRSELASVFCDQRIYAIGGVNSQHQALRTAERFDLVNRKWERVADMYTPRANGGMWHYGH